MVGQARRWWAASRRRRRRVTWSVILLVVAVSVGSAVIWLRDTGNETVAPVHPGKVQVYVEPKRVPLGPNALKAAQVAVYRFLQTAVLRDHVEDSYALIAPSLRQGLTRKQWASGSIPIVPYPVDLKTVQYQVLYSYASGGPDDLPYVGLEVAMKPKRGEEDTPAMRFSVELEAAGTGASRRWLVDQWGPEGRLGGEPQGKAGTAPPPPPNSGQLPTIWLLVPVAVLGGLLLIPLALGVRAWLRSRRLARSYEA